ncbi:MAG: hypothetical protein ACOY3D_04785 [Candidatus Omnitrophota bacterium]
MKKTYEDYEKRFEPGLEKGIPNGLFMTWFYLDYRFGQTQETIAERLSSTGTNQDFDFNLLKNKLGIL